MSIYHILEQVVTLKNKQRFIYTHLMQVTIEDLHARTDCFENL